MANIYDVGDLLQTYDSPDSNWLQCNGQVVNSTTYPALYSIMTTTPNISESNGAWYIKAK